MVTRNSSRKVRTRASPSPGPHPGLLLASSLDERWRSFARELARARRHPAERTVHDLRVAARRLMATIDLISAVRDDQALRKARRDLRKHLKAFGPLRDTHVQILEVRALARRFPVLRSYLRSLSQTEAALIGKARAYLARMRLEEIEQTLARSRGELAELLGSPEMHRYVSSALVGEAGKSFLRAAERLRRVNAGDPASIHRLRVAFKRCRYTLEILRPMLPGASASLLKGMNAYQTRMGVIQDSVVLSSSLARFAVRNTRVSTAAMGAVQHALVERRRGLIQEFLERADELHRFWRAPSGSPVSSQTSRE